MNNIFNSVPVSVPKKNLFDLSHEVKTTFEMGQLVPFFCEPVIPGDRFKITTAQLIRFAPMLAPIMSQIDVYVHFFFVPTRLVWDKWEDFITQAHNGKALAPEDLPKYPTINMRLNSSSTIGKPYTKGTLLDYLGFQTYEPGSIDEGGDYEVDALPFRVYQKIYFDYYRDQNLSDFDEYDYNLDSGKVEYNYGDARLARLMSLQRRAWKKDYFTSALPFAQKGEDVLIPGQPTGSITGDGDIWSSLGYFSHNGDSYSTNGLNVQATEGSRTPPFPVENDQHEAILHADELEHGPNVIKPIVPIDASKIAQLLKVETLGNPDESTIRDLRRAYAAQRFLERKALGGSRYIEQNLAFFGVKSSDARLQRAEFLGGMRQPVVISQVLQTSQSTTTGQDASPLGQPAGNGVSTGSKFIFNRFFEEYGYVMGLISVVPKADYMTGIPKKYLKRDPYDYYWPQFAKIGEQPIQNQELYHKPGDVTNNEGTFGYTPRYAEYRFINNHIHGDFKDTLDFWTLARKFDRKQNLNEQFITCDPSTRVFAYEDNDFSHLWVQIGIDCKALRPITKYGESL